MRNTVIVVLLLFITGCSTENQSLMRVGSNSWLGYESLYLSEQLGYWSKEDIRMVPYPSASEVIRAFRNKTLEAAALTLDEVLLLWQDNIPAEVVVVLDISMGADVIIAKPGIREFTELKGKKVAIEDSALGAYVISRALEINDMSLSDINIVRMDVSEHEIAFREGSIDAVVTFEPVKTRLLKLGGKEIFSSREIPNEIIDVLVVDRNYLKNNLKQVKRLAKGWAKALTLIDSNDNYAENFITKRLNISRQELIESYEGIELCSVKKNRELFAHDSASLKKTLFKLSGFMMNHKLLKETFPMNAVSNGEITNDVIINGDALK